MVGSNLVLVEILRNPFVGLCLNLVSLPFMPYKFGFIISQILDLCHCNKKSCGYFVTEKKRKSFLGLKLGFPDRDFEGFFLRNYLRIFVGRWSRKEIVS